MKPPFLLPSNHSTPALPFILPRNLTSPILNSSPNSTLILKSRYFPISTFNRRNLLTLCSSNSSAELSNSDSLTEKSYQFLEITNPNVSPFLSSWRSKFSLSDQASFLFTFIACTASVAFISLVAAAVPTLFAMRRAANSFAKLADTAREELPSTMAAIRLSGMEISDLTVELSDLSSNFKLREIKREFLVSAKRFRRELINLYKQFKQPNLECNRLALLLMNRQCQ
ncbi:uncharacterized protein LOC130828149 isoform X2 [Amaranthus tricolor]|uniref:uncharacterized protein LOC130828149 isoform X2 n=1 Tax=Amaranthus tricolor TaxID=29722 RepID=UPI002588840A|nr:uncharacterized protein LOC130828149 isoform X2 [Amaranthus tricolor]